jgi:hypothetical protein
VDLPVMIRGVEQYRVMTPIPFIAACDEKRR